MCRLGFLGSSRFLPVCVLHALSFLMSDRNFPRDPYNPRSLDDASLPPPSCFSEAELGLALPFPVFLVLLSFLLHAGRPLSIPAPRLPLPRFPSRLLHDCLEHEGTGCLSASQRLAAGVTIPEPLRAPFRCFQKSWGPTLSSSPPSSSSSCCRCRRCCRCSRCCRCRRCCGCRCCCLCC